MKMKKILLVLIALMGIGFGAKAQSCEVGADTYVAVQVSVNNSNQIVCQATWNGSNTPTSGTVYVTVYYINTAGDEDSEMITIDWRQARSDGYLYQTSDGVKRWYGSQFDVKRVKRWEVSAGACRIERN